MKELDVIIIGGGAAGLFCGAKSAAKGHSSLIIEHNASVGRKIQISGGGKANFTNIHTQSQHYISSNTHFVKSALSRYSPYDFLDLVNSYGVEYYEKKLGQYFCKKSAKDLIDILVKECIKYSCTIKLNEKVLEVQKADDLFTITTNHATYTSRNCVIASGGLSIAPIGATDIGYKIAKKFGHSIIETYPSLVPYLITDSPYALLSGTSIDSVVFNERASFRENILFTHKGLSGPAILQISNYVNAGESFFINFLPNLKPEFCDNPKTIKPTLKKIFTKKFVDFLYENIEGFSDDYGNMKKEDINKVKNFLFNFKVTPSKTAGYIKAEVTKGGVDTKDISSKTMESKLTKGLYFVGEVLDITGHLGGFNFQWAWASANAASEALE